MSPSVTAAPLTSRRNTSLRRSLDVIRISALRALKVRYRGTALGVLWSFASPVLMTAVYTAIFGTAFSRYYGGSVPRYVLSAFVGLAVVTFFVTATSEALGSVVGNGSLLNKIALSPAVFPLSSVAANLFQQLMTTVPVLLVISVLVTHDPLRIVLFPLVLLGITLLTTGFGLALAALFVFFRDLAHLWGIIGFVLWLTSPVFYPAEVAPPQVRPWLAFNPVGIEVSALREVVLGSGPVHFGTVAAGLVYGVVACLLGAALFQSTRRDFMDLV